MKLLHIDSAATGAGSVTRELTSAIVARWQDAVPGLKVSYRDLDSAPLPHLTGPVLAKVDQAVAEAGEQALTQFLDSDVIVIGAPMYNFSVPSTLKAWIDRVAVAGRTFRYTENGPEGLAKGKRVVIASGRGGLYGDDSPADFQEAYLRQVFGFLGVTDIEFVRAEGVAYSPQHRADALAGAKAAIREPLREAA
ncbi:FMN-dependent NADH-azoreductase [Lysobacter solisilvae (ex Woo and Kim 2020)]|uniref:FMN dependent NADH:quinone oxidoreductase n=1 Tax=Agrilutibacter terrestris TaxID=2865112 RepID=A0A7H0FX54_9GAMM|nr:FMN-dependent NADH-azoreductase [Lysobacter terrestris]QNP40620.1 FMN-dependent NADH-azoreductase [Lysobacter terrestris]